MCNLDDTFTSDNGTSLYIPARNDYYKAEDNSRVAVQGSKRSRIEGSITAGKCISGIRLHEYLHIFSAAFIYSPLVF